MFRSFPLPVITPMLCVFGSYTFHLHPLSDIHRDIHSFHTTCCSALRCCHLLWRLLTSHSSLLLRQMRPSVRPHGISPEPFPVYSPDLRIEVTVAFGTLMSFVISSAQYALISDFCPSSHGFAIASSRLYLTVQTLQVTLRFVGNYAPRDFHLRFGTCPSYNKTARIFRSGRFVSCCLF